MMTTAATTIGNCAALPVICGFHQPQRDQQNIGIWMRKREQGDKA